MNIFGENLNKMKPSIFSTLFISLLCFSCSGLITRKEVNHVKKSKLIVALTGFEELDSHIKAAITSFWSISEIEGFYPKKEAYELLKKEDNLILLNISKRHTYSTKFNISSSTYRLYSTSMNLFLIDSKKNSIVTHPIPIYDENETLSKESIFFATSALHSFLTIIDEGQLRNNIKLTKTINYGLNQLNNYQLIVPEHLIDDETNSEKLSEIYGAKISFVDHKGWVNAILERKINTAYPIVVGYPINGDFYYKFYITDAHTGKLLVDLNPEYINVPFTENLVESLVEGRKN